MKTVNLRLYFEMFLHVLVWLVLLNIARDVIETRWVNIFKRFVDSNEWEADKYSEWSKQFSYSAPYLFFSITTFFNALFFYVNTYVVIPKYHRQIFRITVLLLLTILLCSFAEILAFKLVKSFGHETPFWGEFIGLFQGPFDVTFAGYLYLLLFCFIYYFVRKWLIQISRSLDLSKESVESNLIQTVVEVSSKSIPDDAIILIKSGIKKHPVRLNDILYLEASGNHVFIVTDEQRILTMSSLTEMHRQLPFEQFCRIHRSFVVALQHVKVIENHQVRIADLKIPIGRAYKEEFLKVLQK